MSAFVRGGPRPLVALLALSVLLAVMLAAPGLVAADADCRVPPSGLTAALSEDGAAIVLTWTPSGDCEPDRYAVYRREMDVDGDRMSRYDTVDGASLTYSDSAVEAGKRYRYRVRSNNIGPRSGYAELTMPEAEQDKDAVGGEGSDSREESSRALRAEESKTQTADGATWTLTGETSPTAGNTETYTITLSSGTKPTNEYAGFHLPDTSDNQDKLGTDPSDCTSPKLFCVSYSGHKTTITPSVWNGISGHDTLAAVLADDSPHTLTATLKISADAPGGTTIEFGAIRNDGNPRGNALLITVGAAADTTAPTLLTATVDGDTLVLTYDEALDGDSTPDASAFSVTVGSNAAAEPSSVSISGSSVTLRLTASAAKGDSVTVSYTAPGTNPLQDAAENEVAALTNEEVENLTGARPGMSGPAQVDATLTASTTDISDKDGLTSPSYTYQWVRVDGSNETNLGTASTYTVAAADLAKTIKVIVRFEDDDSNAETRTSDETTPVVPAALTCGSGDVWCGIVTTGYGTPGSEGTFTLGFESGSFGSLSDETFTHGVSSYNITDLSTDSDDGTGGLFLKTDPVISPGEAGLVIHIQSLGGEREMRFADATVGTQGTIQFVDLLFADVASGMQAELPLLHPYNRSFRPYTVQTDVGTKFRVRFSKELVLSTATVDGDSLVLTYDEDLDDTSTPAATDFTVKVDGSDVTVSDVAISGKTVTLTLANAVAEGDTVTVSYDEPTTNPLKGTSNAPGPPLSDEAVTNNTPVAQSSDATLSGLVVKASDGSVLELDPDFLSSTTVYTAYVANSSGTVTVEPTTNDDGATFDIRDATDTSLSDVSMDDGHQVTLVVGDNVVNVKVTAEDGNTTETYTVTVTRVGDPVVLFESTLGTETVIVGLDTVPVPAERLLQAQRFTTGSNAEGYLLDGMLIRTTGPSGVFTVRHEIRTVNASTLPGDLVHEFAASTSGLRPVIVPQYTPLEPDTEYFLILDRTPPNAVASYRVVLANDGNLEASLAGWQIGGRYEKVDTRSWTSVTGNPIYVRLTGTALGASSDATLSGLTLNDGTSDLTLTPAFASATTSYTLSVPNATDELTVTATTTDDGASTEVQDENDVALTDANSDEGFQVSLDVGANTIQVEVTAEDSSTETYTVVVTRAAGDTTPPTLVSSPTVDGDTLVLIYNESLDGASTPDVSAYMVSVGSAAAVAPSNVLVSGSTVTLTLTSAASQGDTVFLDYTVPGTNAIKDAADNEAAALTNQPAINQTDDPPTLSTATVDGATLVLTYSEPLDGTSTPGTTAFSVSVGSAAAAAASNVEVSGSTVTLTLASAASQGDSVWLTYIVPGTNAIKDVSGNEAAALDNQPVINQTDDPPTLSTATVDGATLVLTYSEPLDGTSTPDVSAFSVTVGSNAAAAPSNVSISGLTVILTLASAASEGDTVTVTYSVPGTNPIQDAEGNDAAALTSRAVVNNTAAIGEVSLVDAPRVTSNSVFTQIAADRLAQGFTAGAGAILSSVSVDIRTAASNARLALSLHAPHSVNADNPGNKLADLVRAGGLPAGRNTFTLPDDTRITPGNYFIVVRVSQGSSVSYWPGQNGERMDRTQSGWSIDNTARESHDGGSTWGDASGGFNFSMQIRGVIADTTAPELEEATYHGTRLELVYDEDLNESSTPAAGDFAVDNDGTAVTVSNVAVSGKKVTLTLASDLDDSLTNVTVSYTPGTNEIEDEAGNEAAALTDEAVTYVLFNRPPVFIDGRATTIELRENAAGGNPFGPVYFALDPDDTITAQNYGLAGADADSFQLVSDGLLGTKDGVTYDFETKNSYQVTIRVRDNKDADGVADTDWDATLDVTINLTDVNEAPSFTGGATSVAADEGTPTSTVLETYTATDPDAGATLTFALEGVDAAHLTITKNASGDGELKFAAVPDFESPVDETGDSYYNLTVRVSDGDLTVRRNVTVGVNNVEELGSLTITGARRAGATLTAVLTDPDGGVTTQSWTWQRADSATGPWADVTSATSSTYTLAADDVGKFIRVVAGYRDNYHPTADISLTSDATVAITAANTDPEFSDASATRSLDENTAAGVNVGAAVSTTDPDSDTLTYGLTGTDAASFEIDSATGQIKTKSGVSYNYESKDSYSVTVQVRDGKDVTGANDADWDDTIAVTINLTDVNDPPVFPSYATTGKLHAENQAATTVIALYEDVIDEDGDTLIWSVSGIDGDDFTITDVLPSGDPDGKYELRFKNVPDFESPTDRAGDHPEEGMVAAMDNDYYVDIIVSDGTDETILRVYVGVTNVDEPGSLTITGMAKGGETLGINLTDPDGSISNRTSRWQRAASATGPWADITSATSSTYTLVAADVGKYIRVVVNYRDAEGSGKSLTSAATGPIAAGNADPMFPATVTNRSFAENTAANNNVGAPITATDADDDTLEYAFDSVLPDHQNFTLDTATGQIKTKSGVSYSYEDYAPVAYQAYEVSVVVRDKKDAAGNPDLEWDAKYTLFIELTDVNEAPVITRTIAFTRFPENLTTVDTLTATDPDNNGEPNDAANTLTWSVEPADDGALFQIDPSSGELSFKQAPDFENPMQTGATDNEYRVTLKVTDNGIDGARGTDLKSDTIARTVLVENTNEPPEITTDGATHTAFDVDENTATSTIIKTYSAEDQDAGSVLTWGLTGEDHADFTLTKNAAGDAELRFASVPNFEDPADDDDLDSDLPDNVYEFTILVRDNGSPFGADTLDVEVTVNDLNETPVISGGRDRAKDEIEYTTASHVRRLVDTYTATDDDGDSVTWSLSGVDAEHFTIEADGALWFAIQPDYERPLDADGDNIYQLTVEADDGQGETDAATHSVGTFDITVEVLDVNEHPEIVGGVDDEQFAEIEWDATNPDLTVMSYTPRDEETDPEDLNWVLDLTDSDSFELVVDSATGVATLQFRAPPNYEDPTDTSNTSFGYMAGDNKYQLRLRVNDGVRVSQNHTFTVTVTNVDETPEFTWVSVAQDTREVEYDSAFTANDLSTIPATTGTTYGVRNDWYWYRVRARDEDGDDIEWSLTGFESGSFRIDEDPDFVPTVDGEEQAIIRWAELPDFETQTPSMRFGATGYHFDVNASDGTYTATQDGLVIIRDVNERPEFTSTVTNSHGLDEHDRALDAQGNPTEYVPETILSYTGRDEEGGVTWSLSGPDAADFEIDAGGNVQFVAEPNFEDPKDAGGNNVYNFNVVMTDILSQSNRRTATEAIRVTVRDVEETGAVWASNLDPVVGDTIRFEASDPDGIVDQDQSGFGWAIQREVSGSWVSLNTPSPATLTTTYTVTEDDEGHRLRALLRYFDSRSPNRLLVNQHQITSPPTAAALRDPAPNVPPRLQSGTSFVLDEGPGDRNVGRLVYSDRDGDALTYTLVDGQDSVLFEVNSTTGQIRAVAPLDFETSTNGILLIGVEVSDGKGVDDNGTPGDPTDDTEINDDSTDETATVNIRLNNLEEEGEIALSAVEPEVGVQLTATLSDGDGGISGESWQWARSENATGPWANISGATSSSYTPVEADEDSYLRVTVSYTDARGPGKTAERISDARVPSDNRRPSFPAGETGQRGVDENTPAGRNVGTPVAATDPEGNSLTYTLTGADADAFSVVAGTGQIRTREPLDFETKSSYSFTIEVHDRLDSAGQPSTAIDDTQDVTITVNNVDEPGVITLNSATNEVQARVELTATLSDEDGISGTPTWQWERSRSSSGGWSVILTATSATFEPTDVDTGGYLRVTASYADDHGSGKTARLTSPRIGEPPPVNSAPVFPTSETGRREVGENIAAGDPIGAPVVATDLNEGDDVVNDPLEYFLGGTDADSFTIDAATGQVSLATGVALDYETKRSYSVTVEVTDGHDELGDDDMDTIDARRSVTITVTDVNEAPEITGEVTPTVVENSTGPIATYQGNDPERDTLAWSTTGANANRFWISPQGRLHFAAPPSYEDGASFTVTITAADDEGLSDTFELTVAVTDVEEAGVVTITPQRGWVGTQFAASLADGDGGITGAVWQWSRSSSRACGDEISGANSATYTPVAADESLYLCATASYSDDRGSNKEAQAVISGRIEADSERPATNTAPSFANAAEERSVGQGTQSGRAVGAPVRATDPDAGDALSYALSGVDAGLFAIDSSTGLIRTFAVLDYDETDPTENEYSVTVSVHDGFNASYDPDESVDATVTVTITVTQVTTVVGPGVGGGGAGAPALAVPSEEDFDWNVTHDIESLDPDNDEPTGLWSDGETLWVLNNAQSGQDSVFAYDFKSGERRAASEFSLDNRNRFAHGLWSDGETIWVSDSGADRVFAYDLETGERLEAREFDLHEDNRDPRGIWSGAASMYVLDAVADELFRYSMNPGELLARYKLDSLNGSPRGIWSDGATIWVSDDVANRVFAYRIVDGALVRHEDEEFPFQSLLKAGNGDPRGIWSDLGLLYVVDGQDDRVATYNMPDAIDARLGALSLEALELPGFSPQQQRYALSVAKGISQTTVEAAPAHEGAAVEISPVDADGDPQNGHQVALDEETEVEIEVTVTSEDGSRTRVYVIAIARDNRVPVADEIPPLELVVGGEPVRLVLGEYFSDPDGDPLRYILDEPTEAGVVSLSEMGGVLTLTVVGAGATSIELSASDGELLSSPGTLAVTVEAAPSAAETVRSVAPEVRIAARQVDDERVEFALQVRAVDGAWQQLILPQRRFLSATALVDRWHVSTAMEVGADEAARTLRIGGRRLSSGSVEFALLVLDDGGAWSARLLPLARFLPVNADQGQWRYSSPLRAEAP